MKHCLLALAACCVLIACAPATVAPAKTQFIVVAPAEKNMQDAHIEPPPTEQAYAALAGDYRAQEAMLVKWGSALLESLGEVNRRLKAIREGVAHAQQVYGEEPAK